MARARQRNPTRAKTSVSRSARRAPLARRLQIGLFSLEMAPLTRAFGDAERLG